MFSRIWTNASTKSCSEQIEQLKTALRDCDAVIVGAGAGLSTSAGFPIWKIRFGLYWFGAGNRTGFSRLAAALRPHCGLIHYGFFKSCFCFGILGSKIKTSVLTEVLI